MNVETKVHWYCPECGRPKPALWERETYGYKTGLFICADCKKQFREEELTATPIKDWVLGVTRLNEESKK